MGSHQKQKTLQSLQRDTRGKLTYKMVAPQNLLVDRQGMSWSPEKKAPPIPVGKNYPEAPGAFNGRPDRSIGHPEDWWLGVSKPGCLKARNPSNWSLWVGSFPIHLGTWPNTQKMTGRGGLRKVRTLPFVSPKRAQRGPLDGAHAAGVANFRKKQTATGTPMG